MKNILLLSAFILSIEHFSIDLESIGIFISTKNTQVAIERLQPNIKKQRSQRLAKIINLHSHKQSIDPFLVSAVIFRESSFSKYVESGQITGRPPFNCIGLMQIHPYSAPHDYSGRCNLKNTDCNIRTGIEWLSYIKTACGDTHWQWVAAYGLNHCPTYAAARKNSAAISARRFYCKIRKNCNAYWPRWEKGKRYR